MVNYDVPDEIIIPEPATDATDATHYRNVDRQNGLLDDGKGIPLICHSYRCSEG